MTQIQQQLAHLNTVRESLDIISNALVSLKDGVNNIDLSSVISKIEENTAEITNKISQIQVDLRTFAKEDTLIQGVGDIINAVENIDLSSVESKVEEESQAIQEKIGNIKLDTTELSKQGDNPEATNTKILEETLKVSDIDQLLAIQLQTIIGE